MESFARELNLSVDEARDDYIALKQRMFEKGQAENLERRQQNNFTIPGNLIKGISQLDEMRIARGLKFPSKNTSKKASPSKKDKGSNSKRANGGSNA